MTLDQRKDLLWIILVATLILAWGSIPTWAGYRLQTPDLRFRGIYNDSQDYAVHIAAMEAGRHGEWGYQFRFTTEPHRATYFKMFYIVLGHFSKWLGLSSEVTFHLARWTFGYLALYALYRLAERIFPDLFWARTAFALAALGSGIGWLQVLFDWRSTQITPIDFWLIDDYVFFSLSVFPHFAFVLAGMCLALSQWLDFLNRPHWKYVASIVFIAMLVQFVNPIAFATIDISLFAAAVFSWWNMRVIRRKDIAALLVIAIAQVPLLIANFLVLNRDPMWSLFTAQNQTLSPPPDYYVWGFALFWPLAVFGMLVAFRSRSAPLGAATFWVTSAFLLAYLPVYIQRRFLQGVTIPLGILATAGIAELFRIFQNQRILRWRPALVLLYVSLTALSSIQLSLGQVAYLQTHPEHLYYPASLDRAVAWFRERSTYNDFVLASERTSQVLAQRAGLRAYFGHEMETLHYQSKKQKVEHYFQGRALELADPPVKWVVYGPFERELSPDFQAAEHLELVYDSDGLQIYRVK